jgi:DNA-damage-inducible protein J
MKRPIDLWLHSGYITPMSKTTVVRARIEPKLKLQAEKVFARLGLSTSEAIQLMFRQATLTQSLPFPLHLPNAQTKQALRESQRGIGATRFKHKSDLYRSLGL